MFEDPPLLGIKVESPGIYFCGLILTLLFVRRDTPFLPVVELFTSSAFSGDYFLAAPNYMEFEVSAVFPLRTESNWSFFFSCVSKVFYCYYKDSLKADIMLNYLNCKISLEVLTIYAN